MFEDLVPEKRDQMYMVRMSKTTKGYLLSRARQIGTDGATLLDRMVRQFMQWEGSGVKTHTGTPNNSNDAQTSFNSTYDNEASQAVQAEASTPVKRTRKPRTQNTGAKTKSKPGRKPKAASTTNTKKVTKTRGRPKVSA